MDMFQIDWWHEEVDKMEQGFNQDNAAYISTFYKNVTTAIDKVKYGMELKANNAKRKMAEAQRTGASEKTLKMIERSGKPSEENLARLAGLNELAARFVAVQVEGLKKPIAECRQKLVSGRCDSKSLDKLSELSTLQKMFMESPYYIAVEQENATSSKEETEKPSIEETELGEE